MSKTYDINWIAQAAKAYYKRCVVLATAWLTRYRSDPFFRTEVNVITLQVAFGLVILGLVGISFGLLYRDITSAIVEGIRAGIASHAPDILSNAIVDKIQEVRTQTIAVMTTIIVLVTVLFGYIVARITLKPARSALSAQKQFIGNIAHELRTPLAIIKTNTEISLLDPRMSAELKTTMHSNVEELDRISEIINNLLSLSTLVRPERIQFMAVDLSAVTLDIVAKFSQLAKKNQQEVTVRSSPGALVWGSHTALEQIVGNVLKNAMTYTPQRGTVVITIEPAQNDQISLCVEDSGSGIARKDLFRIFEPFYRAEQSRTRSQGGTGLGLAIVSELIKLHQGKIVIRSSVGRGTAVNILLPAAKKRAAVGGKELGENQNEIAVDFSRHTPR